MTRNVYLRIALLFGLLGAVLVLAYFFTLYWIGSNVLADMNRLDILIILLCVLFAMGYFRDRLNGGTLHFWQGLVLGLPVVLISVGVSTLVIYGFVQLVPEVFAHYISEMTMLIRKDFEAGRIKDPNDYRIIVASLPSITPLGKAVDIFIKNFFICFFATGILTTIMRKHAHEKEPEGMQ